MFKLLRISGDSFSTSLKDGQRVLCRKIDSKSSLYINDTIILNQDPYGLIAKKITFINIDKLYLTGTYAELRESKNFGYTDRKEILYKVVCKIF